MYDTQPLTTALQLDASREIVGFWKGIDGAYGG
jgi:hypothetical protein